MSTDKEPQPKGEQFAERKRNESSPVNLPNASAANIDAAKMWRDRPDEYAKRAQRCVEKSLGLC